MICHWLLLNFSNMPVQESSCTLRVIINTAAPFYFNGAYSNSSFEPTFNDYLNSRLQRELNCTFVTITTFSQTEAYQAVSNGSADLVLTNSGTHACLTVCPEGCAPSCWLSQAQVSGLNSLQGERHAWNGMLAIDCQCLPHEIWPET